MRYFIANDIVINAGNLFVGRQNDHLITDAGEKQFCQPFTVFCVDPGKGRVDYKGHLLAGTLDDRPVQREQKYLLLTF